MIQRRLYVDLDGVLADFDGAFKDRFGVDNRKLADDDLWAKINATPNFFADLPVCYGALTAWEHLRQFNPTILTACPKSDYVNVARQKREWVRRNLSGNPQVIQTPGGTAKPLYMAQKGDVLIDDFERNCAAWDKEGGIAIQHEGGWPDTLHTVGRVFE